MGSGNISMNFTIAHPLVEWLCSYLLKKKKPLVRLVLVAAFY